jgi:hypothetical protein
MFSLWIVTNITSARGTVLCRLPCGDQLVVCGQYSDTLFEKCTRAAQKHIGGMYVAHGLLVANPCILTYLKP